MNIFTKTRILSFTIKGSVHALVRWSGKYLCYFVANIFRTCSMYKILLKSTRFY